MDFTLKIRANLKKHIFQGKWKYDANGEAFAFFFMNFPFHKLFSIHIRAQNIHFYELLLVHGFLMIILWSVW